MTDREVLDALTVLARRWGLLDPDERLAVEQVPVPDAVLCLAFGRHGQVRLCCTYDKGHDGSHSWQRACVGKSACVATVDLATGTTDDWRCEFVVGHDGVHGRTGADGTLWTWTPGGRPAAHVDDTETGELGTVCGAQEWGTNGHRMSCVLRARHEGAHRGVDADGTSVVTWPCPCYPDCTGHAVDWSAVQLHTDSPEIRCGERAAADLPVVAGAACDLLRDHKGMHGVTLDGQNWVFGAIDPTNSRT